MLFIIYLIICNFNDKFGLSSNSSDWYPVLILARTMSILAEVSLVLLSSRFLNKMPIRK
jgi:hypothetical protein